MKDFAERRSDGEWSLGSAGSVSRPLACPSHRGFTLIEVMIALVIIGLAGLGLASFSMQSYRTVQNLTIRATAENLAEVTLEELTSMAGSTLYSMTHSSNFVGINFPENLHVDDNPEAWAAATIDPSAFDSTSTPKKFFPAPPGTYKYHVLCNGQLLLGTYNSFFAGTGTPGKVGSLNGSGAVVKTSDVTKDLFNDIGSPWNSVVTVTGPSANDYNTIYNPSQVGFLPSDDTSYYTVYRYKLGSGIFLEPVNNNSAAAPIWHTAGLLVFASTAPHLYREVTITDAATDITTPSYARMYRISVRVIWTFGAVRQVVEVTGGKADLR